MSGRVLPIVVAATVAGCASPGPPPPPPTTVTMPGTTVTSYLTPATTPPGLPGTDRYGFLASKARCDGTVPTVMARTAQSEVVVCPSGEPGHYYWRSVRLSDGGNIELPNAIQLSGGFEAVNPHDGTKYRITPKTLDITPPNGQLRSEPVTGYVKAG